MNREQDILEIKELLRYMASALVDNKDAVEVTAAEDGENSVVLELRVADEDMGRVIGKNGRRAQAMRSIISAKAVRCDLRCVVNIVDVIAE